MENIADVARFCLILEAKNRGASHAHGAAACSYSADQLLRL